jgi:hypothetical protein
MTFWKSHPLTDEDKKRTDEAEKELEVRKKRVEAVHAEVVHIVYKNHLAEKFHQAFMLKGDK